MKTYRLVASLMAESLAVDQITGRLTAFNMLESLFVPRLPAALGKLAVIAIYEVEGEGSPQWQQLSLVGPNGDEIARSRTELVGDGALHRSLSLFQGLRFESAGTYRLVVEAAWSAAGPWSVIGERRLHVDVRPHPLAREDAGTAANASVPLVD